MTKLIIIGVCIKYDLICIVSSCFDSITVLYNYYVIGTVYLHIPNIYNSNIACYYRLLSYCIIAYRSRVVFYLTVYSMSIYPHYVIIVVITRQ